MWMSDFTRTMRPEVVKLLASLLQRSRIGSPVPEDLCVHLRSINVFKMFQHVVFLQFPHLVMSSCVVCCFVFEWLPVTCSLQWFCDRRSWLASTTRLIWKCWSICFEKLHQYVSNTYNLSKFRNLYSSSCKLEPLVSTLAVDSVEHEDWRFWSFSQC